MARHEEFGKGLASWRGDLPLLKVKLLNILVGMDMDRARSFSLGGGGDFVAMLALFVNMPDGSKRCLTAAKPVE